MSKQDSTNRPSSLLSAKENEAIFSCLGRRCTSLATAVVQVYEASPNRDKWTKKATGVGCFVKDNTKRSYYIRIFDLLLQSRVWEQELYNQFKYNSPRQFFHTFSSDKCSVGLNFADPGEANNFKNEIDKKLRAKQQRRNDRRGSAGNHEQLQHQKRRHTKNSRPPPPPAVGGNVDLGRSPQQSTENISENSSIPHSASQNSLSSVDTRKNTKKDNKNNKAGKKKRLTKEDIGIPENFQHVGHIGWDPDGGFDINSVQMDDNWRELFQYVGVTEEQMHNQGTMEFIYDFVEKSGGIENFNREIKQIECEPPPPPSRDIGGPPPPPPARGPPAPPSRGVPPPPPPSRGGPPPPPPSRGSVPPPPPNRGGPPPNRGGPPPPPPSRGAPRPPRGAPHRLGGAPTPAPPPPPPIGGPAPPPPPPVGGPSGGPPSSSGRGGLLDQIQSGTKLKKISDQEKRQSLGGRDDLLKDIRSGKTLKSVIREDSKEEKLNLSQLGGIAGALQRALQERQQVMHSSDEDEDSQDEDFEDEDDWSD